MAVVFMLGCLVHWRVGASRIQALVSREAVSQAAATPSEPPKLAPAAPDRDAVAQMVHDLRSPLSAVLALVDKQGADKAEAVHHDFLRSVRTRCNTACRSRSTSCSGRARNGWTGRVSCRCRCKDLAHSAADQVLPLADKKGVSIDVRDGDETLWVAGDYCMLLRAVVNLLENAVKYSASGTRVTLGAQRMGNAARLYVADQGVGIAAEALPRLCQAFYRAAGARRHCQDGVGMGLAIVAAVAKGHGAEVMVKSRPSQGSTFILTMPLLRGGALENEDPPELAKPRKARRSGWSKVP